MADEKPKTHKELQEIFFAAWSRAGVSSACELCGQTNWTILFHDSYDGVGLPVIIGDNPGPFGMQYRLYAIECDNCGNIRLFSQDNINRLAQEPDKK